MEAYTYKRLQSGQFRLVTLKRGSTEDDIYVSIENHSFEQIVRERSRQKAETSWYSLSYTWGDLEDVESITVVDSSSAAPLGLLNVTCNLTVALRHLRQSDLDRLMWIDAICIDQGQDEVALKERAAQVSMMHRIYSHSTGVIIWLGPEANESGHALRNLHQLGADVEVNWQTMEIVTREGRPTEAMLMWKGRQHTTSEYMAMFALLDRPWFSRVWIKQEALMAAETSSFVQVGKLQIRLDTFRKSIHCLSCIGIDSTSPHAAHEMRSLGRALSICERAYVDEPSLMARMRMSNCRDLRDKVYGNLGIMSLLGDAKFAASIDVDYRDTNSVENTYQEFIVRHQQRYGTLRLLNSAGLHQASGTCPSWVPDWRVELVELDLSMEMASSHFALAECAFQGNDRLVVQGCAAFEVSEVHYLDTRNSETVSVDWYREFAVIVAKKPEFVKANEWVERCTRAVSAALNAARYDIERIRKFRQSLTKYIAYLLETKATQGYPLHAFRMPEEFVDQETASGLGHCLRFLKTSGMPLITSEDGSVGIGPSGSRRGDRAFGVLGCKAVLLLRPLDQTFQLVGPCSVHGFNWGEALLGPLPDEFVVEPQFVEQRSGYVPYFVNKSTKRSTMWDPRIAWHELEPHPPMVNFQIVTAPPGEPLRIRPDSKYLRQHGVDLRHLVLV